MSALQTTALIAVVVAGTAVVFTPEPLRQTMVLGIFGLTLTILFFTFQAPDVALSEIVVSGVGMPLIILAALRKIRSQAREQEGRGDS
jgi:energy-converting hydrogenase B subunit D